MKTAYILRHAKSSWDEPTQLDFDRPLNGRGKKDAPRVGEWLRSEDSLPDLILCSAAKRAQQTAEALIEAADFDGPVYYEERFYDAEVSTWLDALANLPRNVDRVLVVGHNPTLEELVYALCRTGITMPTAALVEIDLPLEEWGELSTQPGGTLVRVRLAREK
jgi:phosphohistidine phosphatase